jgi:hypothetical protein
MYTQVLRLPFAEYVALHRVRKNAPKHNRAEDDKAAASTISVLDEIAEGLEVHNHIGADQRVKFVTTIGYVIGLRFPVTFTLYRVPLGEDGQH